MLHFLAAIIAKHKNGLKYINYHKYAVMLVAKKNVPNFSSLHFFSNPDSTMVQAISKSGP